jgi:hypothetical protein
MIKEAPWFIYERAIAFASLVLTKCKGVTVRAHNGSDMAIDLLVEVSKDGKSALRFFGVQLAGYLDLPAPRDADERVLLLLPRDPMETALPICVFVIGVRKPEGMYRWVVEPVIEEGRALLRRDAEPNWHALDETAATRLIAQVNRWYDVLQSDLTPKRRERRAKVD